jgi:hemolysin III
MHSSFKPPIAVKWHYDRSELIADGVVHVVGVIAAVIAVAALFVLASPYASRIEMSAIGLYSFGLIAVKLISAVYNMWPITPFKWALRRYDHAAIYILIAGTYTPFLTQIESGAAFWGMAGILWVTAAIGVALKIWLPGRFDRLAIAIYLGLGWSGLLAIEAVVAAVPTTSLWLIVIGGTTYSLGVIFHVWQSLRFHNAIWHVFVLAASGFLYWAVMDTMVIARL